MVHFHFGEGELQDCVRLQNVLHNSYLRDIAKICTPWSTSQSNFTVKSAVHDFLKTYNLVPNKRLQALRTTLAWSSAPFSRAVKKIVPKLNAFGDVNLSVPIWSLVSLWLRWDYWGSALWVGWVALQILSCRVEKNRDWWPKQIMIFCLSISADKRGEGVLALQVII